LRSKVFVGRRNDFFGNPNPFFWGLHVVSLGLHVVLAKQLADNWQATGGLRAAQKKAYFRKKTGLHSGHLSLRAQHS